METTLVIAAIVVVLLVAGFALSRRRSQQSAALRQKFGPEYQAAVERHGDSARAEAELAAREKRVKKLDIRPLPETEQRRFVDAWRQVQASFVDNPAGAVREANRLIKELMQAKGYPVGDFDQRAADLSVEHPQVVESYRLARQIADANERGQASTDDLRGALVHYRALFAEVLEDRSRTPDMAPMAPTSPTAAPVPAAAPPSAREPELVGVGAPGTAVPGAPGRPETGRPVAGAPSGDLRPGPGGPAGPSQRRR
jgi:hypothetical protein